MTNGTPPPERPIPEVTDKQLNATYANLVNEGDFAFGEPKNEGSSVSAFIGTVKRLAKSFTPGNVFVRPKS